MGEIRTTLTLENAGDREYFLRGDAAENDIRQVTVDGIVDTGAVSLVVPEELAARLGLTYTRHGTVVYADERRDQRPVAGVRGQIGELATQTECIVGAAMVQALVRLP